MSNLPAFLAEDAVKAAFDGKQVGIVTRYPREALALIEQTAKDADVLEATYRANGREAVHILGGGGISFYHPSGAGFRGTTLGLVLVDLATTDPALIADIRPCLAVSGGHLIGYYC